MGGAVGARAVGADPTVAASEVATEEALAVADRTADYEAVYPVTGITERERIERAHGLSPAGTEVRALLGPLADGAPFRAADGALWSVVAAYEPRGGAIPVVLEARSGVGVKVTLELLRDGDGVTPPARAAGLAAFVTNGGDGATATREQQGLAAMALVGAVASRVSGSGVLARLSSHGERTAHVVAV